MDKRKFCRLSAHEQEREIESIAWAIDKKLNLFGRETVEDLLRASWSKEDSENCVQNLLAVGPDFPAPFIRAAQPICRTYLRYASYRRAQCTHAGENG